MHGLQHSASSAPLSPPKALTSRHAYLGLLKGSSLLLLTDPHRLMEIPQRPCFFSQGSDKEADLLRLPPRCDHKFSQTPGVIGPCRVLCRKRPANLRCMIPGELTRPTSQILLVLLVLLEASSGNALAAWHLEVTAGLWQAALTVLRYRRDEDGELYYECEFTVQSPKFFRHNLSVYAVR